MKVFSKKYAWVWIILAFLILASAFNFTESETVSKEPLSAEENPEPKNLAKAVYANQVCMELYRRAAYPYEAKIGALDQSKEMLSDVKARVFLNGKMQNQFGVYRSVTAVCDVFKTGDVNTFVIDRTTRPFTSEELAKIVETFRRNYQDVSPQH